MYLDRHQVEGMTPEALAAAHELDLQQQEKYGVKYHTYWFDDQRQTVFCLAEGPNKDAVDEVHRVAHGALAQQIIELDPNAPLNAMLGNFPTYPPGTAYVEPALRAIVFTDIRGSVAQTQALGDEGHLELLRAHNQIVREALQHNHGREVKHTGDGIMASFGSVASAVAFAIEVQRQLDAHNQGAPVPLEVGIGVSAGEPVTDESEDLFGAAVQLAARLCAHAQPGDVCVSLAVRELLIGKQFTFEDLGEVSLKGMNEPTHLYSVTWR